MNRSTLLERALWHIREGLIVGKPGSSGPALLEALEAAFEAILEGENAKTALGITRTGTKPRDPEWDYIARVVHNNRKLRVKWEACLCMVNEYRLANGMSKVSLPALREAVKLRKAELDKEDSIVAFVDELRARGIPPVPKKK